MNAIDMLKEQHREVEKMFEEIESLGEGAVQGKKRAFAEIADALAVHATIEEDHFYPAVRAKNTEGLLLEALEEHLGIKRVIEDLLKSDPKDDTFDAKVKVLKELVEHHVEEEESQLFPKVKKIVDNAELEAIAAKMKATARTLERGEPRKAVPGETKRAAPLK